MKDKISESFREHSEVVKLILNNDELLGKIEEITNKIISSYKNGGKVVVFGNGGSAADAQHISAELVGKFKLDRPMLNSIALNVNASIMTAIANDISYDDVFSRQVENLVDERDVVIGLTTSGNSENVIRALRKGKEKGSLTVALTGKSGGKVNGEAEIVLNVPSDNTPRIQEMHITAGHIICEIVEQELFGKK